MRVDEHFFTKVAIIWHRLIHRIAVCHQAQLCYDADAFNLTDN
ncbi:hypothetical protein [Cysteiniphilum sp. SYW-8]|nr:hypothetical protein [Cysteiniphilum sp. SYW-8]